jgi:hypothetical protein
MKEIFLKTIIVTMAIAILTSTCPCFGADQVINGCYSNKTGALRYVTSSTPCKNGETRIFWNQAGPPGVANGITAGAYAYVDSDGSLPAAIPPSEAFLGVTRNSTGNYSLALDPEVFLFNGPQPRCIVNAATSNNVRCAQVGWEAVGAQINCFDANLVATDTPFSVFCVQ